MLVAIFSFTPEVQQQYVLQQILSIAILVFHVIKRPYRENAHNIMDLCLLALIPTVLGISFFQLFNVITSNTINHVAMAVQIILLYLPLVYIVAIMVYRLYRWRRSPKVDNDEIKDSMPFKNIPARVLIPYAEYNEDINETIL